MTKLKALCVVASTFAVLVLWRYFLWTTCQSSSLNRRTLVLRLYDLNCVAPFSSYKYPHEILWLSDGVPFASSDFLLNCHD
jgi:hypothetical protein